MTTPPPDWPEFTGPELCRLQAHELVALLKKGEVSPRDCLDAAFARIEAVEPHQRDADNLSGTRLCGGGQS